MGRPRPADAVVADGVPAWVRTYVHADWERPEDDTCTLAVENHSPEFGRIIQAHSRYSAARREWLDKRGLTSRDLEDASRSIDAAHREGPRVEP